MVKLDQDIENKARQILLDNGLYQVPTDLVKLAQNEKIGVKAAIFNDEEVAGLLSFKDDQTTIYVNTKDTSERRRFTIAHELGHYFLKHENEKVDKYRTINGSGSNKEEQDANRFAAALLMDAILVKNMWNDFPSVSIMADIFKVSFEAMSIRVKNLGLIQ